MKFKDKYDIAPEFESLFSLNSKEEELEHMAKMISVKILSEIETLNEKPFKKKKLADILNVKPSYVTQLYNGVKLLNIPKLAQIEDAYNVTFEIKAIPNKTIYKTTHEVSETIQDDNFSISNAFIEGIFYQNNHSRNPSNYQELSSLLSKGDGSSTLGIKKYKHQA